MILLFLLQIFQAYLPLNTEHLPNVSWHLSFNTAASFITNTNWQSYSGEARDRKNRRKSDRGDQEALHSR